jgi:hypothetical protein
MLVGVRDNHRLHQKKLEEQMRQLRVANEGTRLTIQDYANKLGIGVPGIENIRELFERKGF